MKTGKVTPIDEENNTQAVDETHNAGEGEGTEEGEGEGEEEVKTEEQK